MNFLRRVVNKCEGRFYSYDSGVSFGAGELPEKDSLAYKYALMYRPVSGLEELSADILRHIDRNPLFSRLRVKGEITEISHRRHIYFSLGNDAGTISIPCVCFANQAVNLGFEPKKGDKVWVCGSLKTYKALTRVQIVADFMYYDSEGQAALELERLKAKLAAEGLFTRPKRPIPAFPRRIGVVTSAKGKVIYDIIRTLQGKFPGFSLLLADCKVQGKDAPESIAQEIAKLNFYAENAHNTDLICDVLIVARGGGSDTDLSCYNSETVARAVFGSKLPVISAVGHTADETLCDMVADVVCGTPTAAAEKAYAMSKDELIERLKALQQKIFIEFTNLLTQKHNNLLQLNTKIAKRMPQNTLGNLGLALAEIKERLNFFAEGMPFRRAQVEDLSKTASDMAISKVKHALADLRAFSAAIEALNPMKVLERGYALVRRKDTYKVISSVGELQSPEELLIQFADGFVEVVISGVHQGLTAGKEVSAGEMKMEDSTMSDNPVETETRGEKTVEAGEIGYAELFAELRKAVEELEASGQSLEKSMELYRKAVNLSKRCQNVLNSMEAEIKKLSADDDAAVIAEDFSEGGQRLC